MLESVKISCRQSEIRQELAAIVGKEGPTEDETRSMETLDAEYRSNETRYRAALIAEDQEREQAKSELETRSDREWSDLVDGFELRQVALALDEGRRLEGATNEVVSELRSDGGYRGVPVPWAALETRAGETVAAGTPDPIRTAPIIDRLFADSVAARMGGSMINVGVGELEYPVTTSQVSAGWTATETGNVPGPNAYTTVDRPLRPDHNLGVQMRITRKALKQSGAGLEQAVRRDMNGAISEAMDRAVFLGSGTAGEPTGLFTGAAAWGITETAAVGAPSLDEFMQAAMRFMIGNAANSLGDVRILARPEVWRLMEAIYFGGTDISHWQRLTERCHRTVVSSNAVAAPTGDPLQSDVIMNTSAGGVPPFFVGAWGAVDVIRDPFADAQSGALRLTALATMDVTISRPAQTEIMTGLLSQTVT